ncbi:MAG: SOS response-associated peptidase [Planctomycetia bacterium]|nr:SOS response-associated peptidase [Planctomycetia bacterium]
MCGRFTLRSQLKDLIAEFAFEPPTKLVWAPRFNVAPTQNIAIVKEGRLSYARWGLIPSWADDPKVGSTLINAKAEEVAEKPTFRSSFRRGRCLILADGFYEWKQEGKVKQPYYIRMADDRPFAFAGLADHWERDDRAIDSATILTTEASPMMSEIHDRMPVILPKEAYELWLDPQFPGKEALLGILKPYSSDDLLATPVGSFVNSPRNDDPWCINPL